MRGKNQFAARLLPALLLAGLLGILPPPTAHAADQTVTSTNDSGVGSLRQALADVHDGGTITFDLPTYPATITLTSGELAIDRSLTLTGPGAGSLTISGGDSSRVLKITAGTVTISGLTIADGRVTGAPAEGGGIHNAGSLTLQGVTVTGNQAEGDADFHAGGGGIFNGGTLTVEDSAILGNTAWGGGWVPRPGDPPAGYGGGIFNYEGCTLAITNSRFEGNVARGADHEDKGGFGLGGAIASLGGDVTIEDSLIAGNTAGGGDGPSYAGGKGLGGGVWSHGQLTILDSTLSANVAQGGEGGPHGGEAGGGAIFHIGQATVEGSTLGGNTARGGNASGSGDCGDAYGGGISSQEESVLTVEDSTLGGNVAQGGVAKDANPGGAYGGGSSISEQTLGASTVTFVNCTISGNQAIAQESGLGGGLYTVSEPIAPTVGLSFCTIAGNSADHRGGGIYSAATVASEGPLIKSTIAGDNSAPTGPDIFGTVRSRGWNLVGDDSNANLITSPPPNVPTGNILNQAPRLGPLQDNGGPTWTHALLDGDDPSPAIDKGSVYDISYNPVDSDQRGFSRPYPSDGRRDIGAYEWGPADLVVLKEAIPTEAQPGQTITFTLTLSNSGRSLATGVVLTDHIPTGLPNAAVVSSSLALTDTGASPPFVWQVEDVVPGHSEAVTLTATLNNGLPAGYTFTNTAIITTTGEESNPGDNLDQALVTVLNAPPVAVDDSYAKAPDGPLTIAAPGVLANDSDANGDPLTAVQDSDPISGTLAFYADGALVYTPTAGFAGTVTFTYHARDGAADSNVATVTLTVEPFSVYLPVVLRNR